MMKKRTTVLLSLALAIILLLTACQWTTQVAGTAGSSENDGLQEQIDSAVFPKDKVIDVKITIDEADFQDMLDNASAEEYKEASVNYNGMQFDHVGIRTKGNLSLRSVVNSDSDRYSFKISFDEYLNQTLNGISKINLNNNYSDASYMREFLTYELAESVGLPTPGFSYVNVYVNDELWGFYLAIEQIGDSYLQRHFDHSYGALYKAQMTGSGSDLAWLGSDPDSYTGLVMKSKSSNDDVLIDMLDELNNGTDYEKVLDVDNVLKYVALNVVASNMDSYLGMNKQNYYLYENNGIFSVLPWDYNMAFGGFGGSGILIDEPTQSALAERPLIAKLLEVDEYKERYHAILSEMLEGYMQQDHFEERVAQLQELISEHVKQDPRPFYSYEEYEQSLPALTSFAEDSTDNIQQQLDGTIPSAGDGSGSGGGMGPGGGGGLRPDGAGVRPGGDGMVPGGNTNSNDAAPESSTGTGTSMTPDGTAGSGTDGTGIVVPNDAPGGDISGENTPANSDGATSAASGNADVTSSGTGEGSGDAPDVDESVSSIISAVGSGTSSSDERTAMDAASAVNPTSNAEESNAEENSRDSTQSPNQPSTGGNQPTMPQAQTQNGQGQMPDFPQGQMGNGFGGEFGGQMQGGRGMGRPGDWSNEAAQEQGSTQEALYAGVSLVLLLLSCLFVTLYKRKRL
ncbi:CotH kinase family protein [Paenibacillus lautus]|uniref:CotH kinase family protein n=1 Tax=Paenibacillus lautus TaxID=1401 RepID=UPI00203C5C5B|nr:CotH kinase family protein [Paenibacillus lautus]MCM3258695.1 CotH kinase family protein [Paenibacillus lautus]